MILKCHSLLDIANELPCTLSFTKLDFAMRMECFVSFLAIWITRTSFFKSSGTCGIIMAAPSHYDARKPIDVQYSKVDKLNIKVRLEEA